MLPRSSSTDDDLLNFSDLFENGRTIEYHKLPEKLWAATGYRIADIETFRSFGLLRNKIQHFACPNIDLDRKTGEFIYKVIDPLIGHFWDLCAAEYCDDEELEYNLLPQLISRGLEFRCPKEWESYLEDARKTVARQQEESIRYKELHDAAMQKCTE